MNATEVENIVRAAVQEQAMVAACVPDWAQKSTTVTKDSDTDKVTVLFHDGEQSEDFATGKTSMELFVDFVNTVRF